MCDRAAGGKTLFCHNSNVPLVTECASTPWGKHTQEFPNKSMTCFIAVIFSSLRKNLSFSGHQFLHGHLKDIKVYIQSPLGSIWERYWLKVCTEKLLLKVFFQVIICFQLTAQEHPQSTEWTGECCWCDLQRAPGSTTPKPRTCPCSHQGFLAWEQSPYQAPSASGFHRTALSWHKTERGHERALQEI